MPLPCPACAQPLGLSLDFILKNPVCGCPYCNTYFNFNVNESIKQEFNKTMREIDEIKKKYKGTTKFS